MRRVFKPGEIRFTLVGVRDPLGMLPFLALIWLRNGRSMHVGVGAGNFLLLPRLLMTPSIALSSFTAWRNQRTPKLAADLGAKYSTGTGVTTSLRGIASATNTTAVPSQCVIGFTRVSPPTRSARCR